MRSSSRRFSRAFSTAAAAAANPFAHVKSVAVIGGGVAGLNAARALTSAGMQVTIFEAAPALGGVWRSNYDTFGLQVPRNLYEFLDFPMADVPSWTFPTGAQVQAHILAFAARFVEGKAAVRTSTRVEALSRRKDGARGWTVTTQPVGGGAPTDASFDFVAVCTGMYGTPHVPQLAREGGFAGGVVHSSTFTSAAAAKGKHVVVLGGAKSALDCAVAAADAGAASTTLLSRVSFSSRHFARVRVLYPPLPPPPIPHTPLGRALGHAAEDCWSHPLPICLSFPLWPGPRVLVQGRPPRRPPLCWRNP